MQPRVVKVGPLIASSATKVGASQTAAAAGYLALNGAAATGGNAANNICLSQSGTAATALLLNGSTKQTQFTPFWTGLTGATIAVYNGTNSAGILPLGSPIYITSAGDDHTYTFAVVVGLFAATSVATGIFLIAFRCLDKFVGRYHKKYLSEKVEPGQ